MIMWLALNYHRQLNIMRKFKEIEENGTDTN